MGVDENAVTALAKRVGFDNRQRDFDSEWNLITVDVVPRERLERMQPQFSQTGALGSEPLVRPPRQ